MNQLECKSGEFPDDNPRNRVIIRTEEITPNKIKKNVEIVIGGIIYGNSFYKLASALYGLTSEDSVHMLIDTPGGSVNACAALLSAMEHCPAPITTEALSIAASCGAILLAAGDKIIVNPQSTVMFHDITSFTYGKSGYVRDKAIAMEGWYRVLCKHALAKGLLSEKEFQSTVENKRDIYINGTDLHSRVAAANEQHGSK